MAFRRRRLVLRPLAKGLRRQKRVLNIPSWRSIVYAWKRSRRKRSPTPRPAAPQIMHLSPNRFERKAIISRVWLIFLLLIFLFLFTVVPLWLIEKKIRPALHTIARSEAKKMAQEAFTYAVEEAQGLFEHEQKNVVYFQKNNQGNIVGASLDPKVEAEFYQIVSKRVLEELQHSRDRKFHISLGKLLQSSILSDYGPDVPVEIWLEGSPHLSMKSNIRTTGINNTMLEVTVQAEIEMGILNPYSEDHISTHYEQPIIRQLIVGDVPGFYPFLPHSDPKAPETQ